MVISGIVPSKIKKLLKSVNLSEEYEQIIENKDMEISNLRLEFKNLEKDLNNKLNYRTIIKYYFILIIQKILILKKQDITVDTWMRIKLILLNIHSHF